MLTSVAAHALDLAGSRTVTLHGNAGERKNLFPVDTAEKWLPGLTIE